MTLVLGGGGVKAIYSLSLRGDQRGTDVKTSIYVTFYWEKFHCGNIQLGKAFIAQNYTAELPILSRGKVFHRNFGPRMIFPSILW